MKNKERMLACQLRRKGWSLRSIVKEINCSKSSVSVWIRDIPLTAKQIDRLKLSQDRGRAKAANHPNSPKLQWFNLRQKITATAQKEISKYSSEELKLIGAALYWAEGYRQSRNLFIFSNCDPDMVKLMMKFLREICKVPAEKLRGGVNIHPTLDSDKAQKYWSNVSGIPGRQFHQPHVSVSRASQQKRQTLPYGTFRIVVSDVILCSKIKGWIEGLKFWTNSSAG